MSKITDNAFLFQKTFGTSGENVIGSFQLAFNVEKGFGE